MIPPLLWAINNHIDKFLVTRLVEKYGSEGLVIISSIFGLVLLPFFLIFVDGIFTLPILNNIILVSSGFFYVLGMIFYIKAFSYDETSRLVLVFNILPVFSFLLAHFFLGERLAPVSMIGGLVVLIGASLLSLRFHEERRGFIWKPVPVMLMVFASLLFALTSFFYKKYAIDLSFFPGLFWQYLGITMFGFLLLFFKSYRTSFIGMMRGDSKKVFSLNIFNELSNFIGITIANYVYLIAPLALVVVTIQAFQSIFVVLIGVVLTLFFPRFGKEDISFKNISFKLFALAIIVGGLVLMVIK